MPQIKLLIGPVELSQDQFAKKDSVLALLYNGYRSGDSIYQIPDLLEKVDLGTDEKVWEFFSTVHNTFLAVSGGRVFAITEDLVATEITGANLSENARPCFTEDSAAIYFAANSDIHKYTPGGATVSRLAGQAPTDVTSVRFISGLLVANGRDRSTTEVKGDIWYSSDAGYSTWSAYNNEAVPDGVQFIFTTFNDVVAVGEDSIEISSLTTDPTDPFYTSKEAAQPFGSPSRYSHAFDGQNLFFLITAGGNRQLVKLVGGREVSGIGFAVNIPINDVNDVSDATGQVVGFDGETFYILTLNDSILIIDDQVHVGISLVFSSKQQEFYIWGQWDEEAGEWGPWNGNSFVFAEPWGQRFVGGRDGKIYTLVEETRVDEPIMTHKWRNNYSEIWSTERSISLGNIGDRKGPKIAAQCGRYETRQDEIVFSNGNIRTVLRTGWRSWGSLRPKICSAYLYDVKRGDNGIVFSGIEEMVEVVR